MIVLSDMQCHAFMQIQTMRPWLRLDQAFVSIAAEPLFPHPAQQSTFVSSGCSRHLWKPSAPLCAWLTNLISREIQCPRAPLMLSTIFHLLVSQLFNMNIEQFEPNACHGCIFDEAIIPKTNRRRSQLRGKNIIPSETHFQPTRSTMCQVLVHLGRRWWGDKSHL